MTQRLLLIALLTVGALFGADHRVFELRIYTANEGKLEALKARFRDHTTALFKKHHMEVVGYWTPEDPEKAKDTFIYILAHPSRAEAEKNWKAFQSDPEWIAVKSSTEKDGALAKKVDSTYMDPTAFSPMK